MHLGTAERVQKGKPQTIQELGKITGAQNIKVLEEFGMKPGHYKCQIRGYQRAQAISALIIHFGNIYCSTSTAELAGFPGKTGLPPPSGKALTPDENRHWNMLSVLPGLHVTAEFFYLAAEKDCQERLIILPYSNFYYLALY